MEKHNGLTVDVVIARFVPILGAILFTVGLGYLIYTSVWEAMSQTVRLGVGFFVSLVIIGSAFSFSEKLRYFADIVLGSGILLLYGTLIYGSRTADAAQAIIPEVATLITAFLFTLTVAYFASLRKSKVILALGILGAYLTPFVIGQNDTWASNISFNAYLIYFAAVNVVIFLLGKEIATHDLIPLNLAGLFFGTYSLYALIYEGKMTTDTLGFFHSGNFTIILLVVLVAMSIISIAHSARYFTTKEEVFLTLGYLLPFGWYLLQKSLLSDLTIGYEVGGYLAISLAYFTAWYYLRPREDSRFQHLAAYVGGVLALTYAIGKLFGEWDVYASILTSYVGLIFAGIYIFGGLKSSSKGERMLSAILFTGVGAMLSLYHIYFSHSEVLFPTTLAVVSLIPAMLLSVMAGIDTKTPKEMRSYLKLHSGVATGVAIIILLIKLIDTLDFAFALLVLPGFLMVLYSYLQSNISNRGSIMRIGAIWLSIGYFTTFLYFISNFVPHAADNESFWKNGGIFTNWFFIKGVFAIVGYFLALSVSRQIQKQEKTERPSFLLVIMAYTSLLLVVNFMIITFCNDIGVEFTTGGPRAIGTTIWWIILSIAMIFLGVSMGTGHRSEKLLGLLLLLLTIGKIGIYDLASMNMDKKIIVLMVVGGLIMMFSYFLQVKGYLKESNS